VVGCDGFNGGANVGATHQEIKRYKNYPSLIKPTAKDLNL